MRNLHNHLSRPENFKIYNLLCVIYVFLMIMSNIFSTKLISINGFTVTGAFLMYPITYVLNFIISEIYGYKNARRCIHYVMITFLCFILSIKILLILPASEHWKHQSSLESLFGLQTRVFIASLIAFATSTFISSYILQKLKKRTKGAYLFIRIIFSLLILEMLDTCLFCFLAFYNIWDIDKMMKFFVLSYLIKLLYEVTIYPFITAPLITKIKKIEKLDILDTSTNFNPLLMDTNYDDSNNLYKKSYLRSI